MKKRLTLSALLVSFFLILVACGGQAASHPPQANGQPRNVQVTITNSGITSSVIRFMASTAYSFTIINHSSTASNFIIRNHPEVPNAHVQPQKEVLYLLPSTKLPPGATQHFTFEFPITTIQSTPEFTNALPGPSGSGKHLPISVYPGKKQQLPSH